MSDKKPEPTAEQKLLARALDRYSTRLGNAYWPPGDNDHKFERTGWLLLRCAVQMIDHGDRARALAGDWAARGYPSGSDEPRVNPGHDPERLTSVEAASQQTDEWDLRRDQLDLLRRLLDDNAKDAEYQIHDTVRILPNEGRRDSLIACGNPFCGDKVTGIGEDRLKNGRCPRCYMFQYRNGREWTDRQQAV